MTAPPEAASRPGAGAGAPTLTVVVLSYARPAHLRLALDSIAAQPGADREILVVDNPSPASPDVAAVVAAHPAFRLHALDANRGFTGGMNAGIALARGRNVLLTEDDIVFEPGALDALLAAGGTARGRAIAAPVILDAGTRRVRAAGGDLFLGPPFRLYVRSAGDDVSAVGDTTYEVTFAPGACLLLPREALDELRGFREEYFMYMEDVELCLRARRHGIRLVVAPAARVTHLAPPATARPAPALKVHMLKNLLATYALHAPPRAWPEVAVRYGLFEGARRLAMGPVEFAAFARAWLWLLGHVPALLRDRARP